MLLCSIIPARSLDRCQADVKPALGTLGLGALACWSPMSVVHTVLTVLTDRPGVPITLAVGVVFVLLARWKKNKSPPGPTRSLFGYTLNFPRDHFYAAFSEWNRQFGALYLLLYLLTTNPFSLVSRRCRVYKSSWALVAHHQLTRESRGIIEHAWHDLLESTSPRSCPEAVRQIRMDSHLPQSRS